MANSNIKFGGESKVSTLVGIVLLLIAVLGFSFVSNPVSKEVKVLKDELISTGNQYELALGKLGSFEQEKEELSLFTEVDRLSVKNAIPTGINQDDVIKDVSGIAKDNGIELNSIGFGKSGITNEGVGILRVNASFEGSVSDLISFLEGLEVNTRFFHVNTISVQLSALEVAGLRKTNFSLSLETYYQL